MSISPILNIEFKAAEIFRLAFVLVCGVSKRTSMLHSAWLLMSNFIPPKSASMSLCADVKLAEWLM